MDTGLGMSYDEMGDVFEKWNSEGELVCPYSPHLFSRFILLALTP